MATYTNPGTFVTEGTLPTLAPRTSSNASTVGAFLGTSNRGPTEATLVSSWSDFKNNYGDIHSDHELGYALYNFYANGGRDAYVVRVVSATATAASVPVTYSRVNDLNTSVNLMNVTATNPGVWGNDLGVTILAGIITPSATAIPTFNVSVTLDSVEVERWSEVSTDPTSSRYVETIINTYSKYIDVVVDAAAKVAAEQWLFNTSPFSLASGYDGASISSSDYNTAKSKLDTVDNCLIINAPGITDSTVVNYLTAYAASRGNSFVVIDPTSDTSVATVQTTVGGYIDTSYGAVYYPMLKMKDPTKSGVGAVRNTPPGGAIVGCYIRSEVERSVGKAPAGYGLEIRGALGLVANWTPSECGTLYDTHSVNVLKAVPGGGIIMNGARTLDKTSSAKYIQVRRTLNYVKQAVKDATEFAVFEANDTNLWARCADSCANVLNELWAAGGLAGASPAEAFFVVCNSTNNTAETVTFGEVHIQVGVAPTYPAEFIVIEVVQSRL